MLLVHARTRIFREKGCFAISCNQAERQLSISGNLATICGAAIERCGFPERNRTCLHTTSAYSSKGASFGFLQAMRFSRTWLAKWGFPDGDELSDITGYKTVFDMNQYFFKQDFRFSKFSLHKWIGLYAVIFRRADSDKRRDAPISPALSLK
jgi:hypothetical protein